MSMLLEKAIKQLESLPKKRQDTYASMIFDELESEARWDELFAHTSNEQIKKMERVIRGDLKKDATSLWQFLRA